VSEDLNRETGGVQGRWRSSNVAVKRNGSSRMSARRCTSWTTYRLGPVEPVLFDLADPRPVLVEVYDEVAGDSGCRVQDALGSGVGLEGGLRCDLDQELDASRTVLTS